MINWIREYGLPNNGMTVADLKEAIKDWPETDEHGDPCEVWICCDSGGMSNIAKSITPLNARGGGDGNPKSADLLIGY